jgi:hypothetical protein
MLTLSRTTQGTIAGVVLLGVAVAAWFSLHRSHAVVDADTQRRRVIVQDMLLSTAYARLEPIAPEPEKLQAILMQAMIPAHIDQNEGIPKVVGATLASTFAQSISLRYACGPTEYVAWAFGRGDRVWRQEEMLKFGWDLDETAKHYLGDAEPKFHDPKMQLPRIMAEADRRNKGQSRIVRVAADAKDWEISIKRVTPTDPDGPEIPGKIGRAIANGATLCIVHSWWAGTSLADVFEKHGETYVAYIAAPIECADGTRHSAYWSYVYDMDRGMWTGPSVGIVLDPQEKINCIRFEF